MLKKLGRINRRRMPAYEQDAPPGTVRYREVPDTDLRGDAENQPGHMAVQGVRSCGGGNYAELGRVHLSAETYAGRGVSLRDAVEQAAEHLGGAWRSTR